MHWMIRSLHSIPGWFFSILTPANAAPPRPAPRDSSREEFRTRLLGLGETGILPRIAARLMCNVMGLREARVSDYCQPIGGVALRAEDPMSTLLRIQRQQEASVLPVVDASGRPVGVVDLSAALRRQDNAQSILSFVRPCPVVDPAANLESVLCRLRNPPERVALAASKGGTLRGRVSVNDLFHYVLGDECRRRNPHPEPGDEPFSSTD
jgi:CBS domain containing-hemolysin-like protein